MDKINMQDIEAMDEIDSYLTESVDHIETVTGSTFQSVVLEGEGPIAVEFMSYGCAFM